MSKHDKFEHPSIGIFVRTYQFGCTDSTGRFFDLLLDDIRLICLSHMTDITHDLFGFFTLITYST